MRLRDRMPRAFVEGNDTTQLDLPRAGQAGFAGGLFAIFVSSPWGEPLDHAVAHAQTVDAIDRLDTIATSASGRVRRTQTVDQITSAMDANQLAVVLHVEGAEAIGESLAELDSLYDRGVRSVGLTWSRTNVFAQGVGPADTGEGLTDAGRRLVRRCNDKGVLIDLSHLNAAGFWDVAKLSDAPLVASHSNAAALCENERNLTDDQLDAIARSGGIVGLNFCVAFLRADWRDNPASIRDVVDHAAYIADRIGIEHVALGSDFDGCDVPEDIGDVTGVPGLLDALTDRGFDEAAVRAIAGDNWLRVLKETWGGSRRVSPR